MTRQRYTDTSGLPVDVTEATPLPVTNTSSSATDFFVSVSRGLVSGYSTAIIDGRIESLNTTDGIDVIWTGHGTEDWQGPLTSAETLDIVSSSANDDSAGTRARTLLIKGLDGNYDQISEVVNLDGTTTVTSTNSYVIVHNLITLGTGGGGQANEGNISVTATTDGRLMGYVPATEGWSRNGFFMVPNDKKAIVVGDIVFNAVKTSGGGGSPVVDLNVTVQQLNLCENLWLPFEVDTAVANEVRVPQTFQTTGFPHKSLIRFKAGTDVNNTTARVRCHLLMWDEDQS
jgi:hypothetical protein